MLVDRVYLRLGQKVQNNFKQKVKDFENKNKHKILNFKEKSKHSAWMKLKGMDQYNAEVAYINKVNELISSHGIEE